MSDITEGLADWGVPQSQIHTEAFGPSSVKKKKLAAAAVPIGAGVGANDSRDHQSFDGASLSLAVDNIHFDRSGKQLVWDDSYDNLLDFAEAHGIEIDSGCRAGNCGACLTAVKSGIVRYSDESGADCEEGTCLPCICVPDGSLSIDA